MARRYIDELLDGIRFSSGSPVSISLETAKRLKALYEMSDRLTIYVDRENTIDIAGVLNALDEEMPEPKP